MSEVARIMLPSRFQINEPVNFMGTGRGRIVGVSFTESAVLYDVRSDAGTVYKDLDSCNVEPRKPGPSLRLIKQNADDAAYPYG